MTTTDINAAIATTRDVYDSVPNAGAVLNYLEAVLQFGAEPLPPTNGESER